jgi:thiamine biosynthesis lipoprotein
MGSAFSFTAINKAIEEVVRIEALISSWKTNSQTSLINRNAGNKPVKVSKELINLITRSIKVSKLSNGYFDITFASLKSVWDFKNTKHTIPDSITIINSVKLINYRNIELNDSTVYLKHKGMKLDFGAIGKGYSANRAKLIMEQNHIENGIVNAGGDLISWGGNEENKDWRIGIADPENKKNIISWLNITDMAVVTSGNYEKFVVIDGVKYCHIINPKTGYPTTGIQSVTIICKNAELADDLATTVFILGKHEGLKLINYKELRGLLSTKLTKHIIQKN